MVATQTVTVKHSLLVLVVVLVNQLNLIIIIMLPILQRFNILIFIMTSVHLEVDKLTSPLHIQVYCPLNSETQRLRVTVTLTQ